MHALQVLLPQFEAKFGSMSLGEYIEEQGYGDYFKRCIIQSVIKVSSREK